MNPDAHTIRNIYQPQQISELNERIGIVPGFDGLRTMLAGGVAFGREEKVDKLALSSPA